MPLIIRNIDRPYFAHTTVKHSRYIYKAKSKSKEKNEFEDVTNEKMILTNSFL